MPEQVTLLLPHPQPDLKVLDEVYKELAETQGIKYLRCRYRPDGVTLRVVWKVPIGWPGRNAPKVRAALLAGYAEVGVVEALRRQAANE